MNQRRHAMAWRGGRRDVFGNLTSINRASSEPDTIPALGSVETVMEASVCPMCALALKISTIEPDGVDVVTCRCPINGDIWTRSSSTKLKRPIRKSRRCHHNMSSQGLFGRVRSSRARAWQSSVIRGLAPSCVLVVRVVDHPGSHMVGSDSLHSPTPSGCGVLGPASG